MMVIIEGMRFQVTDSEIGLQFAISIVAIIRGHVLTHFVKEISESVPLAERGKRHIECTLRLHTNAPLSNHHHQQHCQKDFHWIDNLFIYQQTSTNMIHI